MTTPADPPNPPEPDVRYLPLSGLQHMAYCRRRAALVHTERVWEENIHTLQGQLDHSRADGYSRELRGDTLTVRALDVRSDALRLTGKLDIVEFIRTDPPTPADATDPATGLVRLDRRRGWWRVHPVEYKTGRLRREQGYLLQLCAQALCLEEMLDAAIPHGAIFFGKQRRRLEVMFDDALRQLTRDIAADYHELIESARTPPPEPGPKCDKCSLRNLCRPRLPRGTRGAQAYLDALLADNAETAPSRDPA